MKFKKIIFVRIEKDNDGSAIFVADDSFKTIGANHGESIGVYELVRTHKLSITEKLV